MIIYVQTLLGHNISSLLWSWTYIVCNESERVGLCSVEGEDTNLHLTSASRVEQVVLLIEVQVANTEAFAERTP